MALCFSQISDGRLSAIITSYRMALCFRSFTTSGSILSCFFQNHKVHSISFSFMRLLRVTFLGAKILAT